MKLSMVFNNIKGDVIAHLPQICAGAGSVIIGVGSIMLCSATLKAVPVLDKHEADLDALKKTDKTEEEIARDTTAIYKRTCCKLVGLYFGGAVVMIGGIVILNAGTFVALDRETKAWGVASGAMTAFQQYRQRVIEEEGEEADRRYATGRKEVEIEKTVTDKKGKEKIVKEKVGVVNPEATGGSHIRYIIEGNPLWDEVDQYTLSQVEAEGQYFRRMMEAGYLKRLTENQIWERLHLTGNMYDPDDLICGWMRGYDDPKSINIKCWPEIYMGADGEPRKAYAVEIVPARNIYTTIELNRKEAEEA